MQRPFKRREGNKIMAKLPDHSDRNHGGGPRTPEGKARSSMNSLRHGFTGKTVVLPTEDPAQFEELIRDYTRDLKPVTSLETDLVHELAACRWRLQRLWSVESWAFEVTIARRRKDVDNEFKNCDDSMRTALAFMALAEDSKALPLLIRYETRLTRRYDQVLKEIKALQDQRKKDQDPPPPKPCETNSLKPVLLLKPVPPRDQINPHPPSGPSVPPSGGETGQPRPGKKP